VKADAALRPERCRAAGQQHHVGAQYTGGMPGVALYQDRAAREPSDIHALQRDGGTLATADPVDGVAVRLEPAHAHGLVGRKQPERGVARQHTRPHRSGNHAAGAADGEGTVDRETKEIVFGRSWCPERFRGEGGAQRGQPAAGEGGHPHDWRVGQRRPRERSAHVVRNEREPILVHQIALGERHDAAADSEEREHGEMFARLRHHSFVGSDDQQREVDAGGTGDHGAHECLVAGYVHDAHGADAVEDHRGKTEVDRDATTLLLRQAIGVHAGKGAYKGRLAMVDVAGGPEDHRSASITAGGPPTAPARAVVDHR